MYRQVEMSSGSVGRNGHRHTFTGRLGEEKTTNQQTNNQRFLFITPQKSEVYFVFMDEVFRVAVSELHEHYQYIYTLTFIIL